MSRAKIAITTSRLTQSIVRELLDYDPNTGILTWKWRSIEWFDPDGWKGALRSQRSWNGRFSGKEAFNTRKANPAGTVYCSGAIVNGDGYSEAHLAHRIAFLWMIGRWPHEIDHIDRDGTNNRWNNIHEVTRNENRRNLWRQRTHKGRALKFGHVGLKRLTNGTIQARISVDGRMIYLGAYPTVDQAIAARQEAEHRYGFAPANERSE